MNNNENIMNIKLTRGYRIAFTIVGFIIIGLTLLGYINLYDKRWEDMEYYTYMALCIIGMVLGVVFILVNFNLQNRIIQFGMVAFIVFIVTSAAWNDKFKIGCILFVLDMAAFVITMRFKNVFSTVVTMSISFLIIIIPMSIVAKYIDIKYAYVEIYLFITIFLVTYRFNGVKMNQFFIDKCMGFNKESKTYDLEQLKNQITLVYLVVFIALNVTNYFYGNNSNIANLINNSFLTGVTVTQVDWNKIIYYFKMEAKK